MGNALRFFVVASLFLATHRVVGQDAVGFWEFDDAHIDGRMVTDQVGSLQGTIRGDVVLYEDESTEALQLDGQTNSVSILEYTNRDGFPVRDISLEAWVSVSSPTRWGGLIGAIQDNGGFEKGWVLGYDNSHFYFALSSTGADDGDGVLTYLTGGTTYSLQEWYHVVATYDGVEMRLYVNGELDATTRNQSGDIVYAAAFWFDLGAYHDDNEFFLLNGLLKEASLYDAVLAPSEVKARFEAGQALVANPVPTPTPVPTPLPFVSAGPYLRFTGPETADVRWRTHEPCPSILEYGLEDVTEERVEDSSPKLAHRVTLTGLKSDRGYTYRLKTRIDGRDEIGGTYECDTFFNYAQPPAPSAPSPFPQDGESEYYARCAEHILTETGVTRGYCLIVGSGEGRLAYELAKIADLQIVGIETDVDAVSRSRQRLMEAGLYGSRVTFRHVESLANIPITSCFANLIVSERMLTGGESVGDAAEIWRLLRPHGGTAFLGQPEGSENPLSQADLEEWLRAASIDYSLWEIDGGLWARVERPKLPGAGEWSHQYANPGNSANGNDTLLGATRADQLDVQWVGRPGPRAMVDRGPRTPAPLSTNGRLFTQGERRIIAQDAYNGLIHWALEIPELERFNIPRDSSNWCADDEFVYLAVRDKCWRIDATDGDVTAFWNLVSADEMESTDYDWGYVARAGALLYGTSNKAGSAYTNIWGGEGWYDARSGPQTYKVCSDNLFALDVDTGAPVWEYKRGAILNSTIAIGDGHVYFVESRDPAVLADPAGRIGRSELWNEQYLVSLDAETGELDYERAIDTEDGIVVFYLVYADGIVFIASSKARYYLYAFDAGTGEFKWSVDHGWIADNHGQHMQHPAIVGDTVYLRPYGYNVQDGSMVERRMPPREGGCATFAGSAGALIYRGKQGAVSMWDVETKQVTNWAGLRPACWISTIPASGMVLSPEGGGGCSCGGWLETSLGFMRLEN